MNAIVRPLVAEIQRSIDARTRAGTGAITGYTSALAKALAPYQEQTADIYGRAQAAQAATDSALTSGLRTGSGQAADELAGKLAALPGAEPHAEVARATGQGAAGALAGTGAASLSELIASGAASEAFTQRLPGIARLGGLGAIRDLGLQSQAQLAQEVGSVRSRVPELVQARVGEITQRRDALAQRRDEKRAAAAELAESRRQFNLEQASKADAEAFRRGVIAEELGLKAAGLELDEKRLSASVAEDVRNARIRLAELGLRRADLKRKARESARDYALRVAGLEQKRNEWLSDVQIDQAKLEQAEKKLRLAGKKGGWTKKEIAERRRDVADTIRDGFEGFVTDDGEEVPPRPFSVVARDLVAAGYPLSMVQKVASAYYRPGDPSVRQAEVNGVIYLYRPEWEEPHEGMPIGFVAVGRDEGPGR